MQTSSNADTEAPQQNELPNNLCVHYTCIQLSLILYSLYMFIEFSWPSLLLSLHFFVRFLSSVTISFWYPLNLCVHWCFYIPLHWRHNWHDGVSNHQPHDCLLNRLFRRRLKKTSKLCVTGLCEGNSPGTGEFPTQRASSAENVSIWRRHR